MSEALLEIRDLVTEFRTETGAVRAVKGVDLTVGSGETVALVGESGSGKSVTSLSVMRLIPEAVGGIVGGQILFRGRDGRVRDLVGTSEAAMQAIRGNEIAMIFQEPMTSLNPTQTVGAQVAETFRIHQGTGPDAAWKRAVEMLSLVEIPDAARRAKHYPHQMSGGMRQRVMIAMALICNPALLIADEPTTALDVTVQLQILQLMQRLQAEFGMGILFITHNLAVVAEIADRVAVMYGGRIVERAGGAELFARPSHPYTRGLLASLPVVDQAVHQAGVQPRLKAIPGSVVDPRNPPQGCDFGPRCAHVIDACRSRLPAMEQVAADHQARCLRWREIDA